MHTAGMLKTDELISRFFRLSTEMCVETCLRMVSDAFHTRARAYQAVDGFVRLVSLLIKHSGIKDNTLTKVNLLYKVLGIVAGVLLKDQEQRQTEFQQMPYHRIFSMLFLELSMADGIYESIQAQTLTGYSNVLHVLKPTKAPSFTYSWLELMSNRMFIGRMLTITQPQNIGQVGEVTRFAPYDLSSMY